MTLNLQSCRRNWHPIRKPVERQSPPRGPLGVIDTEVWAVCRFCNRADKVFTYSTNDVGDSGRPQPQAHRRNFRAALSRWRKAKRAQEKADKSRLKGTPA